jgi:hypothetical protein
VNSDDGSFWMELSDFRKYYDKITVCRIFNLRILALSSPIVTVCLHIFNFKYYFIYSITATRQGDFWQHRLAPSEVRV